MLKHELQVLFLEECGILRTFKRWLDPINRQFIYRTRNGRLFS